MTKEGQAIVLDTKDYKIFEKTIYSALNNELKEYIKDNKIEELYLCGFDTDACIQKTAIDLFENGYEIYVLKDYCMTHVGIELHNATINNLKRLIGENSII
jgi:nicotinamidase-related amidase